MALPEIKGLDWLSGLGGGSYDWVVYLLIVIFSPSFSTTKSESERFIWSHLDCASMAANVQRTLPGFANRRPHAGQKRFAGEPHLLRDLTL